MGQGSTENHSRTAKRPVLIPHAGPICGVRRSPPACGWKVTRIPGACASPSFRGRALSPRAGCPISAGAATPGVGPLRFSAFRLPIRPAHSFPRSLSSRSVPLSGRFRLSGRGLLAACRHSASALLLEPRRIGSFLFEHWWGIIKITIQVSVLEGGKREKCFIGNGFMILFLLSPPPRALTKAYKTATQIIL